MIKSEKNNNLIYLAITSIEHRQEIFLSFFDLLPFPADLGVKFFEMNHRNEENVGRTGHILKIFKIICKL